MPKDLSHLTPQQKRERRKEQNRVAQRKSRKKTKEKLAVLENFATTQIITALENVHARGVQHNTIAVESSTHLGNNIVNALGLGLQHGSEGQALPEPEDVEAPAEPIVEARDPDNVFRESNRSQEATAKAKVAASKKRKRGPKKRDDGADMEFLQQMHEENLVMKAKMVSTMQNDSNVNQRKELIETLTTLKGNISRDTQVVIDLLNKAKGKLKLTMKETKKKYRDHKKKKGKSNKGIEGLLGGDDSSDDENDDDDDSVALIFNPIMGHQKEIAAWEGLKDETDEELERVKESMKRARNKENLPTNVLEIDLL